MPVSLSVAPSARLEEQLGYHSKDFREILYLGSSRKSVEKIQI